jgi:hypothetical protein
MKITEIRFTFVFLMYSVMYRPQNFLCVILRYQALVSSHFSLAGVDKSRPGKNLIWPAMFDSTNETCFN